MDQLFLKVVNMSISASWLVLAVLLLRLLFRRSPKWVNILLWGIVAAKLICPLSMESSVSLIPKTLGNGELVSEWMDNYVGEISIIHDDSIHYDAAVAAGRKPVYDGNGGYYVVTQYDQLGEPLTIENTVMPVLATIWAVGVVLLFLYTAISYWRLRRRVREATPLRANIYQCEGVDSPFVLGILKPRIYLSYQLDGQDLDHVLAHEQAHIRRKDHWWKPLGFLLLTIHWFNPLMWLAYALLCRDIELACDEKVIRELGCEQRADYSRALLSSSVNRRMIAACPLAFGEVGVKERVKSVMNYRKPAFWVVLLSVSACVAAAVCFLTNPVGPRNFPMAGQNVADLDPQRIVAEIRRIDRLGDTVPHINEGDSMVQLTADFEWANAEVMRFFYTKGQKTYTSQLRLFIEDDEFFVTERYEWPEQNTQYLLDHYLQALKYLPQEQLRQMAPDADQYILHLVHGGAPSDYDRTLTYTSDGVRNIDGWYIHLQLQPMRKAEGGGYRGQGDDVIHVFYGDKELSDPTTDDDDTKGPDTPGDRDGRPITTLDEAIRSAVLTHNAGKYRGGDLACESHVILGQVSGTPPVGSTTSAVIVYAMVLYQEYGFSGATFHDVGGGHGPAVLTFSVSGNGEYTLEEYWAPRDGGYYAADIRSKFPQDMADDALDTQKYILLQKQNCYAQAVAYGQVDTDTVVEQLLEVICSSPAASSNPSDYIDEHFIDYRELLYYGAHSLRYMFGEFLKGDQTDLRGLIMANICQEISHSWGEAPLVWNMPNGETQEIVAQAWFDAFMYNAQSLAAQYSDQELEQHYPASWLLLQIIRE